MHVTAKIKLSLLRIRDGEALRSSHDTVPDVFASCTRSDTLNFMISLRARGDMRLFSPFLTNVASTHTDKSVWLIAYS